MRVFNNKKLFSNEIRTCTSIQYGNMGFDKYKRKSKQYTRVNEWAAAADVDNSSNNTANHIFHLLNCPKQISANSFCISYNNCGEIQCSKTYVYWTMLRMYFFHFCSFACACDSIIIVYTILQKEGIFFNQRVCCGNYSSNKKIVFIV